MRLPNKYGTVYKLPGKRRRPYVAKKFVGKELDEEKRSVRIIYAIIGYYGTRAEALNALATYNPKEVPKRLSDVFEAWSDEYFPKLKETGHYSAAWNVLRPLWNNNIGDLRYDDIQLCMNTSGKNTPTLKNVKMLINQIYEYAYIHEYIPFTKREMVSHLDVGADNPKQITRSIFTDEERENLLKHDDVVSKATTVLIYTGLRISELCNLKPDDVDYERKCINITQAKTKAGIREVPIADAAIPYLKEYMASRITVPYKYRNALKERFGHLPHDTRHTFATLMAESGCDQRIIDAIMGHASGHNVALNVYTHITLETKLAAVNLLVFCKFLGSSKAV